MACGVVVMNSVILCVYVIQDPHPVTMLMSVPVAAAQNLIRYVEPLVSIAKRVLPLVTESVKIHVTFQG
jgi:hypothetical protein